VFTGGVAAAAAATTLAAVVPEVPFMLPDGVEDTECALMPPLLLFVAVGAVR